MKVTPTMNGNKVRSLTVDLDGNIFKGTNLAGIVASMTTNGTTLEEKQIETLEELVAEVYASGKPAESKPPKSAPKGKAKPKQEPQVVVTVKPEAPKPTAPKSAPSKSAPKVKPAGETVKPAFVAITVPKPHAQAWKMFASIPTVVCSDIVEGDEAEGLPTGCAQAGCDVSAMKRCKLIASHLNDNKIALTHEALTEGRKAVLAKQEEALKLLGK